MRFRPCLVILAALVALGVLLPNAALAQNLIQRPKAHSEYNLELEGHLAFLLRRNVAPGFGLRATWEIVDPGFIKGLNNTVGVGVGLDLGFNTWCEGVGTTQRCSDADVDFIIPVNLQWNFWFTPEWSAFAEPGIAFARRRYGPVFIPNLSAGARYQLGRNVLLVARVGYPAMTLGASYLF
jgi:hypothetical protein